MQIRRSLRSVTAVTAVALVAVGCGASDSKSATKTRSSSSTAGGDSKTDSDLPKVGAAFADGKCRELGEAFDQSSVAGSLGSGDDPTDQLRQAADALEEASDEVPEEIKKDVAVLAKVYGELAERSDDIDWAELKRGNPAAAAGAAALGQAFASGDFLSASQNLTAYVTEHCTG